MYCDALQKRMYVCMYVYVSVIAENCIMRNGLSNILVVKVRNLCNTNQCTILYLFIQSFTLLLHLSTLYHLQGADIKVSIKLTAINFYLVSTYRNKILLL
jgi:hypothetical protein